MRGTIANEPSGGIQTPNSGSRLRWSILCINTTSLQNSRIGSAPAGSACNFLTATVRSFAPFTSPSFQIALYTLA